MGAEGRSTPAVDQQRLLAEVVAATPDIVVITDVEGRTLYANPAARRAYGVPLDGPLPDRRGLSYYAPHERLRFQHEALPTAHRDGTWSGEISIQLADGREVLVWQVLVAHRDPDGALTHYTSASRDLTPYRELAASLEHARSHDPLTGLPGRALLRAALVDALSTRSGGTQVALVVCALDQFHDINASYGHDVGDELLVQVARRLTALLGPGELLARLGGDQFAIVRREVGLEGSAQPGEAALAAMQPPFELTGRDGAPLALHVSASIGVAVSRAATTEPDTLVRQADAAVQRAKELGRNRIQRYAEEFHHDAIHRVRAASDLRRSISDGDLQLLYQPEVLLADGHIVAVEALVRWPHPTRGLVPPQEFVPLAERTGMIRELGRWALRTAAAQARQWQTARHDGGPIRVWVNLSAHQLPADGRLADDVLAVLEAEGCRAESLGFEITESSVLADSDAAAATLAGLRQLGCGVALDDFGTGFSSLTYLKRLPVDHVKIDRSFVDAVADPTSGDAAIVRAILALASALGLGVVGEGVETLEQRRALHDLGCDLGQGFLFATPQPANHLTALLEADRTRPLFADPWDGAALRVVREATGRHGGSGSLPMLGSR